MNFKETLLSGWEGWDGNGVSDIPAKNITLLNGKQGSILISWDGIAVFDEPIENINVTIEEGECFVNMVENDEDDSLYRHISEQDLNESKIVYRNFMKYSKTA